VNVLICSVLVLLQSTLLFLQNTNNQGNNHLITSHS